MIKAVFYRRKGKAAGFCITGHSDYAEAGSDIVCAAVSSAVMLVCNTVTDYFHDKAHVSVGENRIVLCLFEDSPASEQLLRSLYTHLRIIADKNGGITLGVKKV